MEDRHIEHGIQQCLHYFCRVRSHVIHNEDGIAAQMRHQVILKVRLEHFGSRSSWKSKYSAAFRPFESMIRWSYFLTWKAEQNQLLRYRRANKHIVWSYLYYIRFRPKTQDYLLWIQIYGLTSSSVFLLHRGCSCSLVWRDFFLRRYLCYWRKRQTVSMLTGRFNASIISKQVISGCFFISARIFCWSVSESFGFLPRR